MFVVIPRDRHVGKYDKRWSHQGLSVLHARLVSQVLVAVARVGGAHYMVLEVITTWRM